MTCHCQVCAFSLNKSISSKRQEDGHFFRRGVFKSLRTGGLENHCKRRKRQLEFLEEGDLCWIYKKKKPHPAVRLLKKYGENI